MLSEIKIPAFKARRQLAPPNGCDHFRLPMIALAGPRLEYSIALKNLALARKLPLRTFRFHTASHNQDAFASRYGLFPMTDSRRSCAGSSGQPISSIGRRLEHDASIGGRVVRGEDGSTRKAPPGEVWRVSSPNSSRSNERIRVRQA